MLQCGRRGQQPTGETVITPPHSAQPDLYPAEGTQPPLLGQRCRVCERMSFPPNPYGCEGCGALPAELEPRALAGAGTLEAFATVRQHPGRGIEVPFVIGLVVLDDGPAVRATLTVRSDEGLSIGQRVRSTLVAAGTDEKGVELVELRFSPVSA